MLPKMGQSLHLVSTSQIIFVQIFGRHSRPTLMTLLITNFYPSVLFLLLPIVLMHQFNN